MFENEFNQADMNNIIETIFVDKEWGILDRKDPLGIGGCGFFQFEKGKIKFQ